MITLHLVSHTHWDREWYRTFQQFRMQLVNLVDGLLDILDNDPNYKHFMLDGQTIVLDDYLLLRPENKGKLTRYIRSGRIIIGPWYILPDEFLVSPEATIRNLLQGDRTCREFGSKMEIGYIPDPFGHIGQMPQILVGFGIHSAIFRRGLSDEPCEVWWQAPDGSRVFASYLRDGYDNAAGLTIYDPAQFAAEVCNLRDSLKPFSASRHLLLMQGTDHMQPLPGTSKAIASARGKLGRDKLIHSSLQKYISDVQASLINTEIPIVLGELRSPRKHHLLPGVLSTRMWIKQRNHACETILEKWAEPYSTFAQITSPEYSNNQNFKPASILEYAWRLLMENHPHDSICGCSIDQVHEEMRSRFDQVEQIGEEISRQSLRLLVETIDTKTNAPANAFSALIIFNPTSNIHSGSVTSAIKVPHEISAFNLVDEFGNPIAYQNNGIGTYEIINIVLEREILKGIIGKIHDGKFEDLYLHNISVERKEDRIEVFALLAQHVPPNLEVWQRGSNEIKAYILDPTVKTFHIRAQNLNTSQITLNISDVPGMGWKTIWLCPKPEATILPTKKINFQMKTLVPAFILISKTKFGQRILGYSTMSKEKPRYEIENDFFILKLNKTGTLSLEDKRSGNIYQDLNRFIDGGDKGDEYNYCPPENDTLLTAKLKHKLVRRSGVQQSLEADLEILAPFELESDRKARGGKRYPISIHTVARLVPGIPRVDIHTEIKNNVKDHRLRVHFPFLNNTNNSQPIMADYDGHFEVVRRSIGVPEFGPNWVEDPRPEAPQRAFTDISNGQDGLMVANRGLPEVEVIQSGNKAEIALTLLRCVGWLSRSDFSTRKNHAGPFLPTPGAQMKGDWEFDYCIIPHKGFWNSEVEQNYPFQEANHFITPLRSLESTIHEGNALNSGSFINITPGTFVISAVKKTRNKKGWLVRGYNICEKEITVNLSLWKKYQSAQLVNLAEEAQAKLRPDRAGIFTFPARPHEIISIGFYED